MESDSLTVTTRQRSVADDNNNNNDNSPDPLLISKPSNSKWKRIRQFQQKRLILVGLALMLSTLSIFIFSFHPTLFFEVGETYMSCYAPRLSSFNNLFNIESSPCTDITKQFLTYVEDHHQRNSIENPDIPTLDPSWNHVIPSGKSECNQLWDEIRGLSKLGEQDQVMKALHAIAWRGNTTWSNCFEWVVYANKCGKQSVAKKIGIPFKIIGMKTPWRGFGARIRFLDQYLVNVPHHRIVLFTDATDVIPVPSLSVPDLVYRFLTHFNTPTLFMAESECWPDEYLKKEYIQPPNDNTRSTPYIYLNAGSYLGYAWALRDIVKEAYTSDCSDDQRGFTRAYLLHASFTLDENGQRVPYLPRYAYMHPSISYERSSPYKRVDSSLSSAPLHHLDALQNAAIPLQTLDPNSTDYISLDWYNIIFQSLVKTNISLYEIITTTTPETSSLGPSLKNKITGGYPVILHQNGDKTWHVVLQDLMELFGYV